jgi:hypothetical protein
MEEAKRLQAKIQARKRKRKKGDNEDKEIDFDEAFESVHDLGTATKIKLATCFQAFSCWQGRRSLRDGKRENMKRGK